MILNMKRKGMKRFAWMMATMTVGVGIMMGGNTLCGVMTESTPAVSETQYDRSNLADSIADIIQEMKNGDRSRTKSLAEAYRYGIGVEKSMLNAMICYQMADVDFVSEARNTYEDNPHDEFAKLFKLLNMYDRHYVEEINELLSDTPDPAPAWAMMMRKILDYKGDDIDGYILSLIGPDSTTDECFLAFGCFISNNKESDDIEPLNDLLSILSHKVPFFYNRTGQMKLEEYERVPDSRKGLLTEALMDFKKANDEGFLTPRHARRIFEDDIQSILDLESIFTPEELEQLRRLGASTSEEEENAKVIERIAPDNDVVELIESVTVEEAFNLIATLEGFEEVKDVYDFFNFPKGIGEPTMIMHANAKHREEILWFMDRLPEGSMVYDDTDESGRFDRMYLDTDSNDLLYVHVGFNGNDTVLILFQGGNRADIDKFNGELNAQQ